MSAFTPKALEADCTTPVFGPTRPSVLAMRGIRFVNGDDGNKPAPKPKPKPAEAEEEDDDDDDVTGLSPAAQRKIAKANREAANLRARVKELEPIAQAAQEADDAKKDELTKAKEQITDLQSKLEASESRTQRLEIAIEKKLTVKQANRLSGTTREELEADADDFLTDLGGGADDKKTPPPTKAPKENLRGGGDPTSGEDNEITASQAADELLAN